MLFAIYFLILAWLILFKLQFSIPVIEDGRTINLIPLNGSFDDNGVIGFSEIRNNILAFLPFGIYISMLASKWSFAKKTIITVFITLAYEITQYILAIGRADITDVLSNTLGGVIGIGIYALLFVVLKGKTNKVLNVLAAVLTVLILLLIAVLVVNHRWVRIK